MKDILAISAFIVALISTFSVKAAQTSDQQKDDEQDFAYRTMINNYNIKSMTIDKNYVGFGIRMQLSIPTDNGEVNP